jgi:hypothetical protein
MITAVAPLGTRRFCELVMCTAYDTSGLVVLHVLDITVHFAAHAAYI